LLESPPLGALNDAIIADSSGAGPTAPDRWIFPTNARILPERLEGVISDRALVATPGTDNQFFENYGLISAYVTSVSIGAGFEGGQTTFVNHPGARIGSDEGFGLVSSRDDFVLKNFGSISGFGTGVSIGGDRALLVNHGEIRAADPTALRVTGDAARVLNSGLVETLVFESDGGVFQNYGALGGFGPARFAAGASFENFGEAADGVELKGGVEARNYGLIDGPILAEEGGAGAFVFNAGRIESGDEAILVDGATGGGAGLRVTNTAAGEISGLQLVSGTVREAVVDASDGAMTLQNDGRIFGDVRLGAGADVYFGSGSVVETASGAVGDVFGGVGDDRLYGGDADDRLSGEAGDDRLRGGGGGDELSGGDGDDRIYDGAGSDVVSGGAGADLFVYEGFDHVAVDRIVDFDLLEDRLDLRQAGFGGIADVAARLSDDGTGDAELLLDSGARLVVEDVAAAELLARVLVASASGQGETILVDALAETLQATTSGDRWVVVSNAGLEIANRADPFSSAVVLAAGADGQTFENFGRLTADLSSTLVIEAGDGSGRSRVINQESGSIEAIDGAAVVNGRDDLIFTNAGEIFGGVVGGAFVSEGENLVFENVGTVVSASTVMLISGRASRIENNGVIRTPNGEDAIIFADPADRSVLDNYGEIDGRVRITEGLTDVDIRNAGVIDNSEAPFAGSAIAVSSSTIRIDIENTGVIRGLTDGIFSVNARDLTIDNAGLIEALTGQAVEIDNTPEGFSFLLLNRSSGEILALEADVAVRLGGGAQTVMNDGFIGGDVAFGAGDDVYFGHGETGGAILGEGGADRLSGAAAGDWLSGGAGDDVLRGAFGDDLLIGGDGADRLHDGAGSDLMEGGAGGDRFVFEGFEADATDVIVDFEDDIDILDLRLSGLSAADVAAGLSDDGSGNAILARQLGDAKAMLIIEGISASALLDDVLV